VRRDFCTILNLPFLLRGITLYRSLARVVPEFRLYVACMDEESESVLRALQLPGLETISESDLHTYDPPLAELQSRPVADYCKSVKPSLCLHLLERESDLVTFLDADLMFFSDPAPMFDELGEDSILLMPMRRGPRNREEKNERFGAYNSGTVSFRRDDTGLETLRWWRGKILEGRAEDNPLLDQPFIKDWPDRFPGVHVVEYLGCGVAPWNVYQYELEPGEWAPLVNGVPIVFYHYFGFKAFHSVNAFHRTGFLSEPSRFSEGALSLSWQRQTIDGAAAGEEELIWIPYVREVARALADVRSLDPGFTAGLVDAAPPAREPGVETPGLETGSARGAPAPISGPASDDSVAEGMDFAIAYPAVRASGRMLSPVWRHPDKDERSQVRVTDVGDLEVELGLPSSERFYLYHGETGFQDPPEDRDLWAVEPDRFYELRFESSIEGEDAAISLFAIEYDDFDRLGHQRISVQEGSNIVRLMTSPRTRSLRIAIRFSGSGHVRLSPIILSEPSGQQKARHFGGASRLASPGVEEAEEQPASPGGVHEWSQVEARRGRSPVRIALYGEVDMNLIDGSSVWLQSVAQVLTRIPGTEVTVLLRRPEERDILTAPLRDNERIDLIEPTGFGPQTRLTANDAIDALERLDGERRFDLVLLRGRDVSEAACIRIAFAGRLWAYHLPTHDRGPGADVDHLRRLATGAERIVCQTEAIRALVEAAIPDHADKLILLPPMIPAPAGSALPAARNGSLRLFYAGKIAPEYYFLEMTQILRRLRRSHPEAELHVVGDKVHDPPDDPEFKAAAEAALAETENLVWHGGVSRARVQELLHDADVALSIRDPMMDNELATKVLEYGAAGCAVVLNRTPLYEEHLGADYPLFATDPGEAVRALSKLASDPDLRAAVAERCERAARRFTFEKVAAFLEPHLRATIQGADA
jgi:glycosyltransferase involved in cell wall biosynthesis